jgi:hypothetical protein
MRYNTGCDKRRFNFCESCFKEKYGIEALYEMIFVASDKPVLCPECYDLYNKRSVADV